MERFSNEVVQTKFGPVHPSRIISSFNRMSWRTVKYPYSSYPENKIFKEWLDELEISEKDQERVWDIASNGKSELESSCSKFLSEKYRGHEKDYTRKHSIPEVDEEKEDEETLFLFDDPECLDKYSYPKSTRFITAGNMFIDNMNVYKIARIVPDKYNSIQFLNNGPAGYRWQSLPDTAAVTYENNGLVFRTCNEAKVFLEKYMKEYSDDIRNFMKKVAEELFLFHDASTFSEIELHTQCKFIIINIVNAWYLEEETRGFVYDMKNNEFMLVNNIFKYNPKSATEK